ncbi:MAG: aminotransferase class IV [Planctomycetota bacterium]|nr:aminotransferase class IV [Planctomycetota bacterium]
MHVYLNGKMVDAPDAMISAEDAGVQHAVGLFETMAAHHGQAFRLDAHLARLARSAADLGLARTLDLERLRQAVNQTLTHNKLREARLRLTVTAGNMSLLRRDADKAAPAEPTVMVVATPPTVYDPAYFEKGIMALVAPPLANPFDPLAGHKTLSYWGRLRTLRQAASAGAGEAIILNITNHLAGGAVSNVFIIKDGELHTPIARGEEVAGALPAPVLPGITRAAVLELAQTMNINVHKRMISVEDLLDADEAFLTNSSWLVLPVARVEKKEIGSGKAGEMTLQLREELVALTQRETAASAAAPQDGQP